jgi:hypothetical protein
MFAVMALPKDPTTIFAFLFFMCLIINTLRHDDSCAYRNSIYIKTGNVCLTLPPAAFNDAVLQVLSYKSDNTANTIESNVIHHPFAQVKVQTI